MIRQDDPGDEPAAGRVTVDSIEDGTAILESDDSEHELRVPRAWLPEGVREGDVLRVEVVRSDGGSRIHLMRDEAATKSAREEAEKLLRRLRRAD